MKSLPPPGSEFMAHRAQSIALIRYLQHFCEMPGMCLGALGTGWPCFSPGRPFYHITKGQGLLVTMACRAVISAPASGGGWWPTEGNSRPSRSGGGKTGVEWVGGGGNPHLGAGCWTTGFYFVVPHSQVVSEVTEMVVPTWWAKDDP